MNSAAPGVRTIARVALDVPIAPWFDYRVATELEGSLATGDWVLAPWGRGRRVGIVLALLTDSPIEEERLRELNARMPDAPRAPAGWVAQLEFAARYYHRGVGEWAMLAVPRALRTPPSPRARGSAFSRARRLVPRPNEIRKDVSTGTPGSLHGHPSPSRPEPLALSADQQAAVDALQDAKGFAVWVLHGVTGSGKTEVFLRWFEAILSREPTAQLLLMVPEIALTPQLAAQVVARFPRETVAVLHSELADTVRAGAWLAAAEGRARVVIGTRLSVLTPLPGLAGIVVDEEHDLSYRQQEGLHYSARDLAIAAGSQAGAPVLLASATPSAETWLGCQRGRYRLLRMGQRIGGAAPPALSLVDLRALRGRTVLAPETVRAIAEALAAGHQVLVFLNRRGYAPVLSCEACAWLSECPNCSAWRVLHRSPTGRGPSPDPQAGSERSYPGPVSRYRLICHHCGVSAPVPAACPSCGSIGLSGLGQGTQRIEEELEARFPAARIGRLDRDVARQRGAARAVIDAVHQGDIDVLVGTQMLAKGHDFRRLALVVVVDGDAGLFSADFRAPERLFATLMQVSGRAGRDARASRVLIQTRYPEHAVFGFLSRHDFEGFADALLEERRQAAMPPFGHQALLRADAATLPQALAWLEEAASIAGELLAVQDAEVVVSVFDPVPTPMARLKGRERAQLLVECPQRPALHRFLEAWLERLRTRRTRVRWHLEVDPAEI